MSLRLRLGLWHGSQAGIAILIVGLLTYALHTRTHYDDLDRALVGAVTHLIDESDPTSLATATLVARTDPNIALRVYGPDGAVREATPNAPPLPAVDPAAILQQPSGPASDWLARLAPPFVAADGAAGAFRTVRAADGVRWRVYVQPVGGGQGYVAATAALAGIDTSVYWLRRLMLLLAAVSAGIILMTCWLLVNRALRPIALLSNTARAIARTRDFRRRVPATGARDELGLLAATFNEMLAGLEQAYHAQQRFVADASHELRAPLTVIQANLELLERRADAPVVEQQEAIRQAGREARRLTALVADLLALARADAGLALAHLPVEVDRVLLEAFGEARHLARGQRLGVSHLEPTLTTGDPDRLKQLFLILLDNALKYTPPEGRVIVALAQRDTGAEITVRDTGDGIEAADLPHVFDRFYRAEAARLRDPGGSGLGLAIARGIVEQHGGTITLESAPGEGTTATVRLPRRRER